MHDQVVDGHVFPSDDTNELTHLVQDPAAQVENAAAKELFLVADGPHVKVYKGDRQVMIEFTDEEGFVNGLSIPYEVTQDEFCHLTVNFARYVGHSSI